MLNELLNPFTKYAKDWAIVTAGSKESFNSMTIAWGGFGTIWGKSVITLYIRPERYTCSFVENSEYFTVSFYEEKHRRVVSEIFGNKSGRDIDKVKESGFTPRYLENGITYEEAAETYICKKIYTQKLDMDAFPKDAKDRYYEEGAMPHVMFIGEVVGKI